MQFKERLLITAALCLPVFVFSQSTYFSPASKHNHFIDRMEILQGKVVDQNFSTNKPYNRKFAGDLALAFDSLTKAGTIKLSRQDAYNLNSFYANNSEWYNGD
ncbi:MAG: hypothetical protein HYR66_09525, partial [Sphingobacteriales bacterium]|nr:hypothetical protein [Sphingobacteriales bacterium]